MRAYKFRGSSQFDYTLDMIFNKRLFCSDWSRLNDPMEGSFVYSRSSSDENDYKSRVQEIIEKKKCIRVCSLSKTFDCHLLWAHYASGFDGLAVEVELPDRDHRIKDVTYRGVFGHVAADLASDPNSVAEEVLSSKYKEWEYEKEVRILNHGEYFALPKPVTRIIAGHRMKSALFEALKIICKDQGVALCKTGIGDEGIDADVVYSPTKPGA